LETEDPDEKKEETDNEYGESDVEFQTNKESEVEKIK
jgi:hypothetical protein